MARCPVVSLPPFDAVVAEHGRVMVRVCRALLPEHDAEDAAGDALLAALEAYPRLRPDSDVKAWLVTIAHRKALDILRRRARQAVPVSDVPERADTSGSTLPDEQLWSELWVLVRALPDKQRQAVAYRYVADLAYSEVATVMGISEAAARRNAADGISGLRRRYRSPSESLSEVQTPANAGGEVTP
jgi:RNA polymerase sigma factor (sigma-70 family)